MVTVDLDERCGEHFVYRDFVQCGDTWSRLASSPSRTVDNFPKLQDTFAAMRLLCASILDPVVAHFGRVELTYAFASARLTKHIKGRIAPRLDQHAGHEVGTTGKPICPRLGFAVDFMVSGIDSRTLARWVVERAPFDRLYFYESDRPIHASIGPENARQAILMRRGQSGRRVPRVVTAEFFRE